MTMTAIAYLKRVHRVTSVVAAAAAFALTVPSAAGATTCKLALGVLEVNMTGDTTIAQAESFLLVNSGGPKTCTGGTPTTTNTEVIRVVDLTDKPSTPAPLDGDTTLTITEPNGFAPGRTAEPGQVSEIEFVVNMNYGDEDRLIALSGKHTAFWTAGTSGINWSLDGDPDLFGGFDRIELEGSRFGDRFSGRGERGTGAPLVTPIGIDGGEGDDELLGGDGPDDLEPGTGDDVVGGFGGDDVIDEDTGDDSLAGGSGTDRVSFIGASGGIRLDLGTTAPQQASSMGTNTVADIENVFGTDHDDTLIGNEAANVLTGVRGDDLLIGGGGADELHGREDTDTVSYADAPGPVDVDLVAGRAQQGAVIDTLATIENIVGSPAADTLTGDGGPNVVVGGGGTDSVVTADGADRVELRDGERDVVSCGDDPALDLVLGDRRGVDTINLDCDLVDLLPEPPVVQPEPGPDPGPGSAQTPESGQTPGSGETLDPGPDAGSGADTVAPVISGLTVARRRFRVGGSSTAVAARGARAGTTFRYFVSERSTVTIAIRRGTRRATRVGTLTRTARAGGNRVRFSGRIGRRKLRPGSYRARVTATDPAGNRSRTATVRFRIARGR